ncbi:hypothetical protein [Faecalibaculum rodentium]|uniref:hypothetical protein n=1 Tax=Faecalibaculum rodentium TaxID=1702221 RepID=UPI0027155115|nr:hypothetical protein [Faecalibaculum rodentium]
MKHILKKAAALALALSLTGCAWNQEVVSVSPETAGTEQDPLINNTEPITLTVFSVPANWSGKQTGWGAVLLKDMFNVELNIIPDANGTYETRMEKGDLGDIVVWGNTGTEYKQAVDQGKLFDWNEDDLVETYGRDICRYFSLGMEANAALNADGKVYALGNNMANDAREHDLFIYDWGIRWDLYEQLGKPEVKDLDDLLEVLKQMKELCPKADDGKPTYAASLFPDWDGNMIMNAKSFAQCYYGYDEVGLGLLDPYTGDYYDALDKEGPYVEALRFYSRLNQNGLLDPDSMTQTFDQLQAKVRNGTVLWSPQDFSGSLLYNTEQHIADNKLFASLVPEEARTAVWGLSTAGNERPWSIGAKSVYPEKAMQLLNWLFTPEGAMTIQYGIQGLMWDYDSNGSMYFTDLGLKCKNDPSTDLTGVKWTSPDTGKEYTLTGTFNDGMLQFNNTTWAQGANNPDGDGEKFAWQTWTSVQGEPKNEADADWRETTGAEGCQQYLDETDYSFIPMANYAEETRSPELDLKWSQVIQRLKQGSWKAIYAKSDEEFDKIIDQTIQECKGYGYDECVKWSEKQAAAKYQLMLETLSSFPE